METKHHGPKYFSRKTHLKFQPGTWSTHSFTPFPFSPSSHKLWWNRRFQMSPYPQCSVRGNSSCSKSLAMTPNAWGKGSSRVCRSINLETKITEASPGMFWASHLLPFLSFCKYCIEKFFLNFNCGKIYNICNIKFITLIIFKCIAQWIYIVTLLCNCFLLL